MMITMRTKLRAKIYTGAMIALGAFLPVVSRALSFNPAEGDPTGKIDDATGNISTITLGQETPTVVALNLINVALSLLAALCVALLLYAGFLWLWARGNADEVKKAKDIIIGTIIGLVIVLASLGITRFVFTTVANITGVEVAY